MYKMGRVREIDRSEQGERKKERKKEREMHILK